MLSLAYSVALYATVWSTILAVGLIEPPARLAGAARAQRAPLLRAILLSTIGVPLLVAGLARAVGVGQEHGVGLVLVGAAGAGPLGIRIAAMAGGAPSFAIALTILLEFANLITVPLWTGLLSPSAVSAPPVDVVVTVGVLVGLPLVVGWILGAVAPNAASRLSPIARRVGAISLIVVVVLALILFVPALSEVIPSGVTVVAVVSLVAMMAAAWFVTGGDRATRASGLAIVGVRGGALALAIAAAAYASAPGVRIAVLDFSLFGVLVPAAIAAWLGRTGAQLVQARAEHAG